MEKSIIYAVYAKNKIAPFNFFDIGKGKSYFTQDEPFSCLDFISQFQSDKLKKATLYFSGYQLKQLSAKQTGSE